jgi:hypothetical protein
MIDAATVDQLIGAASDTDRSSNDHGCAVDRASRGGGRGRPACTIGLAPNDLPSHVNGTTATCTQPRPRG